MDYAEMNQSGWYSSLPAFKNLLRPSWEAAPVAEVSGFNKLVPKVVEAVRQARADRFSTLGDALVPLVFESYRDWFHYEDQWILTDLGLVLADSTQEGELIGLLGAVVSVGQDVLGTDDLDEAQLAQEAEKLADAVSMAADSFLQRFEPLAEQWQAEAAQAGEAHRGKSDSGEEVFTGEPNPNWAADKTPGMRYYIYVDGRYLYSDLDSAGLDEWESAPTRDRLAHDNEQPWGASEWVYTPTSGGPEFGGDNVFARKDDAGEYGPWVTGREAADAVSAMSAIDTQDATAQQVPPEERAQAEQDLYTRHVAPTVQRLAERPDVQARLNSPEDRIDLINAVATAVSEMVAEQRPA